MNKVVAYFSATGETKSKAEELGRVIGADLHEIVPAVPYTYKDLDWRDRDSRSTREMEDRTFRPAISDKDKDFSAYDVIYIGFPIWWYTAPTIVNTFIESYDFSSKKIVLFATSGGSSIDKAVRDMKNQYPGLDIVGGRLLNGRVDGDI